MNEPARVGPLYPQLRPRPKGPSREQVTADQRRRLRGAMIEAVAERGYEAVSVRQLRALAGVSEKTVYELFASKEAYFLDTYDFVVRGAAQRIAAACRGEPAPLGESIPRRADWNAPGWADALCRAFDAFGAELATRPKAARLVLVEALAAGPVARRRVECMEALLARSITESLAQAPDGMEMPPLLPSHLLGGVVHVARTRLLEGRPDAMAAAGRQVLDWLLSYRSASVQLLDRAVVEVAPDRARPEWAPPVDEDERTRIARATATIAAAGGYAALTRGQIASRAEVEHERLCELFEGVEECFAAGLELLSARKLARALREAEAARDWAAAVYRVVRSLLCSAAADPVFARVAFVEVLAAGPAGMRRHALLLRSFAEVLGRHAPREQRPSDLVAEAIAGALWTMMHHRVARGRARSLPALASHAAYVALAPIVGAERAIEAVLMESATGGDKRRPAPSSKPVAVAQAGGKQLFDDARARLS